jgi:hypothetical protein
MSDQSLATVERQEIAIPSDVSAGALQSALNGDLAKLSGEDRLKFYGKLCEFTGLNPLSKPFDWIQFQGKLTLYPNKGCAEQLRKLHGVTFDDAFERKLEFGLLIMTVRGSDKRGRRDFATAALPFDEKMPAEAKANAIMKLETKAKRRLTLSIAGLTMFARDVDDRELDDTPRHTVQTTMPETASDRAALLNEMVNKAIDVETIQEERREEKEERRTEPFREAIIERAEKHGNPVINFSGTPEVTGNTQAAAKVVLPGPTGDSTIKRPATGAGDSAPANLTSGPVSPPSASPASAAPPPAAVPGVLPEDVVRNLEICFSGNEDPDMKLCMKFLFAKKYLQAGQDLSRLSAEMATKILGRPVAFFRAVKTWANPLPQ